MLKAHRLKFPHFTENILESVALNSKGEIWKTKDPVLFKTRRFDSVKNKFHTSNAADHTYLLSVSFILIDRMHSGV